MKVGDKVGLRRMVASGVEPISKVLVVLDDKVLLEGSDTMIPKSEVYPLDSSMRAYTFYVKGVWLSGTIVISSLSLTDAEEEAVKTAGDMGLDCDTVALTGVTDLYNTSVLYTYNGEY